MSDPKDPSGQPGTKAPRIIDEVGAAVARDIKPALRLAGRIFFNTWLGDQSFVVDVAREVTKGARAKKNAAASPKEAAPRAESASPPSSTGPQIIEAEIIEDKSCFTCGGTGKLGRPGYQVPCPKCR